MSEKKYVLFSGDTQPKLLRPPKDEEIYLWTKSNGERLTFSEGKWLPVEEDAKS